VTDLWMIVAFGVAGCIFARYEFPIAPIVPGCILGPVAETSFMTSMIRYQNDWTVSFTRPVSASVLALIALFYPMRRRVRRRRAALAVPS